MPLWRLGAAHTFPDPRLASRTGMLAVGGDLAPQRLLTAYRQGIFPWYSEDEPILWWSLDPRCVLPVSRLHVPRSLAKIIRRGDYTITMDRAFDRVIAECAAKPRPGQDTTWITAEIRAAYGRLHAEGYAHSVEAWRGDELVGGLYGVAVGRLFCGESMFAHAPDASKVAFVTAARQLERWGFPLIDCQMRTAHLARFGAVEVPRATFLDAIRPLVAQPDRLGPWTCEITPAEVAPAGDG
jgi:leucyl/phenylalanyl-tRNA--protein transferase